MNEEPRARGPVFMGRPKDGETKEQFTARVQAAFAAANMAEPGTESKGSLLGTVPDPTPEDQAAADQALGRRATPVEVDFLKDFNFL